MRERSRIKKQIKKQMQQMPFCYRNDPKNLRTRMQRCCYLHPERTGY
jgi:hypothetical protein